MNLPLEWRDLSALIGVLAICEGEIMLREETGLTLASHLAARLNSDGMVGENATEREVRQALNDLNHRLRYAKGEYDEPPSPTEVP